MCLLSMEQCQIDQALPKYFTDRFCEQMCLCNSVCGGCVSLPIIAGDINKQRLLIQLEPHPSALAGSHLLITADCYTILQWDKYQ